MMRKMFSSGFCLGVLMASAAASLTSVSNVSAATQKFTKTLYVKQQVAITDFEVSSKAKWKSSNSKVAKVTGDGVVSAKKEGKVVITAKDGKNTYKCSITVKKYSNQKSDQVDEEAIIYESFEVETYNGKDVIGVFKNTSDKDVSMYVECVYKDSKGKKVASFFNGISCFSSGRHATLEFNQPTDDSGNLIQYSSYKFKVAADATTAVSHIDDIKVTHKTNKKGGVNVTVKNTSDKKIDYICLSVIYYKDDVPVCFEKKYADEAGNPKVTAIVKFTSPHDKDYDAIEADRYEVYVNFAYSNE